MLIYGSASDTLMTTFQMKTKKKHFFYKLCLNIFTRVSGRHLKKFHGSTTELNFNLKLLKPMACSLLWYILLLPILVSFGTITKDNSAISFLSLFSYLTLNLTLSFQLKPYLNVYLTATET